MNPYNTQGLMTSDRTVQEGGHNVVYDLLGTNEQFKKTYLFDFYVGKNNEQVVTIPYPAFSHVPNIDGIDESSPDMTLDLYSIVTNSGQTETTPIPYCANAADFAAADVGWMIDSVDQDSMAKANYLWTSRAKPSGEEWSFNGRIIKSIKIKNNNLDATYKQTMKLSYRAFYKDAIDSDTFRAEHGPQYTREFGQYILDKLEELDLKTDVSLENMFGTTSASEDILEEDLTGVAAENKVFAELHTVDTTSGKSLLAPAKGSFYPGTAEEGTLLKLFLYHIEQGKITESLVASGEKLGWLFIYTLNNFTVYSVATDTTFLSHSKYYSTNANGDYVLITDYTPGDSIDVYRSAKSKEVFVLKRIPFDPKNQLDGLINESSAVITTQQSVVLTVDNIEKYLNYSGTFVQLDPSEGGTTELVLGQDYEFADVNQAKTEKTYTRQPVYDHIRLLGNIRTDDSHRIGVTYQAFGGQVQPGDVRNLRKDVTNLLNILAKSQLLTHKGLIRHPVIREMMYRLSRMEDYHHHYNRVDHIIPLRTANIVTTTEGTITTPTDETDLQWFNIAQLYGTKWMNGPNARRDIGHFRISSREQGWTYEFIVTVDLSAEGNSRMVVKTLGGTGTQYAKVDDFMALTDKELVGLRLVWNKDGDTSGAILQVGIDYSKYNYVPTDQETELIGDVRDTDTITVTNKSGDTSSWELYYNPLDTSHEANAYVGVYGRSKYVQVVNERAQASLAYFRPVKDYNYFGTTTEIVMSGVDYFMYNATQQKYELVKLTVGTKISEYSFPVFERSLYRTRWVRDTHPDGELITELSDVYVVDGSVSNDTESCTLPDGITTWATTYTDSHCITRILERDDGGTVVWVGSVPLAYFSFGPNDCVKPLCLHLSLAKVFQKYLDIESITALDLTFYDRKEHHYFTRKIHTYTDDLDPSTHVRGEDMFFLEDMCGITAHVGRVILEMKVGDVFLAGVKYFVSHDDGVTLEAYYPQAGSLVPAYELTNDLTFSVDKQYYKKSGNNYVLMVAGTDYTTGDIVSNLTFSVYERAGKYYSEDYLIAANLNVALGSSSYINERFDLRQVRMHL